MCAEPLAGSRSDASCACHKSSKTPGAPGKTLLIIVEERPFARPDSRRRRDDEPAVPDFGILGPDQEIGRQTQPDRSRRVERKQAATAGTLSQDDVLRRPAERAELDQQRVPT